MKKYVTVIMNDIFEGENILIAKRKGEQIIQRYEEYIDADIFHEFLESNNIDVDSCVINSIYEDRYGNPKITRD